MDVKALRAEILRDTSTTMAEPCDKCGLLDANKCILCNRTLSNPAAATEENVVEMALCSTEQVFLKPNQLYRFYVKEGCAQCARIANPG